MIKLRPKLVKENLCDIFSLYHIEIEVIDNGGNFKTDLPGGLLSRDVQDLASFMIIRYIKYKYKIDNISDAEESANKKINLNFKNRITEFLSGWEKTMVQHIGSNIDKYKKNLFFGNNFSNATAFKFSHLNINGQNASLKKLSLGVEFKELNGNLKKIVIHRFNNKHK